MNKNTHELLDDIANYYSQKLIKHGETPLGVDWNSEHSQFLRFEQLCQIIRQDGRPISINDIGCGYGALLEYVVSKYNLESYLGVDISEKMVLAAQTRQQQHTFARFIDAPEPDTIADFSVASGIFNVRLGRSDEEWLDYLKSTLDILDRTSRHGFSFNCLTSYSDSERMRDYLYYADPCQLFDLCKRRYSKQVALLHDYGLYEFTLLIRKTS